MELFPGEIEGLQQSVNIVADGLRGEVYLASQTIVLTGGHGHVPRC